MGGKQKRNNKTEKALALVMLTMLAVGDTVPLFSYATDKPLIDVMETEQVVEEVNVVPDNQESIESIDGIDDTEENFPPEMEENPEDTDGITEPSVEEVNGIEPYSAGMEEVVVEMEEGSTEEVTQEPQTKAKSSRLMTMSGETNNNYVLATDADFSGTTNGNFRYTGDDDYVEIPHTIKGVNVTTYTSLFQGTKVKGVKSTNKNVTSTAYMFMDMETESVDVTQLDTSSVTSMVGMFNETVRGSYSLKVIKGLGKLDTSNVENMASMFRNSSVTELDLSNFDTSNVYSMGAMFTSSSASVLDVSSFDTGNVTSFGGMFSNTRAKDIIGEEVFDTSKATTMPEMFYGTSAIHELDLSNFDTSNVTTMERMFYGASAKELDLRSFDTSKVNNMGNMFQNSKATTIKGLETFDTSKVTNMVAMFSNSYAKRLDLSSFDTSNIKNMVSMFDNSSATYLDVSSFDTSNVTNMGRMFKNSNAEELDFSNFNTSRVTDMSLMFQGNKTKKLDLSSFDTQRVTDMGSMLDGVQATEINVSGFDTTYVTNMNTMFRNTKVRELDLSSFDMRSVNETDYMFTGATTTIGKAKTQEDADKLNRTTGKPAGLNFIPHYKMATDSDFIGTINGSFKYTGNQEYVEVPQKIRGVNVTSYKDMFANTKVKGVISTNTKVTDMSGMFRGATSTELDVSTIDTSGAVNMSSMFQGAKATYLDLRNLVTVNVTNMDSMFKDTSIAEIDLGSFDLTKVTNTNSMFQGTKATTGYVRTQEDLDKVAKSSNYPTTLKFTVWGIKVVQTPTEWTNGDVNLEVESYSGSSQIKETELVNNPGENLLGSKQFNVNTINAYTGAKLTKTKDVAVPEWGVSDAIRVQTVRGSGNFQFYWGVSDTSAWLGQTATHSVYVKNNGKSTFTFGHNGLDGAKTWTIEPGFSGRIESTGTFRTSHTFIQLHVQSAGDIDATFWGHKLELGGTSTPYSPPRDTTNTKEGVYPVYSNGTYILRSTDTTGETRTVAHTVSNIDRGKPTAEVTKSTEGWTSQDVTLYVNAEDTLSGVKSIKLPDGTVINGSTAEYVAKDNKDYAFEVLDNAGNKTSVSTKVTTIDRSIPKLGVKVGNVQWSREPVNIAVSTEDSASGLVGLELINSPLEGRNLTLNSDRYFTETSPEDDNGGTMGWFKVETGGDLNKLKGKEAVVSVDLEITGYSGGRIGYEPSFTYEDGSYHYAGTWYGRGQTKDYEYGTKPDFKGRMVGRSKIGDKNIKVQNQMGVYNQLTGTGYKFKLGRPKFEIGKNPTPWTPAPEDIKLVNNTKTYPVVGNGLYTFKATYNNGATSEISQNITNIDLEAPTLTVKGNPEDYTEDDTVTLNVTATDNNKSGVKSITLPDGKVVNGNATTYTVTENGDYKFILEDNVGNKTTHVEKVDKIMKSYIFYVFDSKGQPLKGVGYQLLRNGSVHATAESDDTGLVDFGKVPSDGTYTIKQVKAPDGYVIDPSEKDVEVGDTTEPEEFVSYPREDTLPGTGTLGLTIYAVLAGTMGSLVVFIKRKVRKQNKKD